MVLLPAMARRYNTTHEKMKAVVCGYKLFEIDNEEEFFSVSLIERMQKLGEKREQAKLAAEKRWNKYKQLPSAKNECDSNADALPMQCDSNASKVKESKVKESKVKNNNNKTLYDDFAQVVENFSQNEELKDSIQDFIEHRKSLKKPIKTIRTLQLILEELSKYPSDEEQIKVIKQSIVNGWQGLFELKQSNKKQGEQSSNVFTEIGRDMGIW
jgi:hypothetical protein